MKIENRDGKLYLSADYYPPANPIYRKLGGKWNSVSRQWVFDARIEKELKTELQKLFGTGRLYTVHYKIVPENAPTELCKFGRVLASRRFRDAKVKLGDGVVIVNGEFPASAGSSRYPRLLGSGGEVTLKIFDVPESLIDEQDKYIIKFEPQNENEYSNSVSDLHDYDTGLLVAELVKRGWKTENGALIPPEGAKK